MKDNQRFSFNAPSERDLISGIRDGVTQIANPATLAWVRAKLPKLRPHRKLRYEDPLTGKLVEMEPITSRKMVK